MKTAKTSKWRTKKGWKNIIFDNKEWKVETLGFDGEKKNNASSETNVSVFTKTTNPKVIVKSEKFKNDSTSSQRNLNTIILLKFLCFSIMCIIILMTFFLSLKTYDIVNELSKYIMS